MADETTLIAREAEVTRERISATVDDLQYRLSPRTIVNDAVDQLGASGAHAVAELRTRVAAHPVALAAAGLAIGVALLARSRISRATIEYGDSYAAYSDYDDNYADSLDDGVDASARARLGAIGDRAAGTVDDNPLAVVAVGLATGALLGTIIPLSATEHQLFGAARARLAAAGTAAIDAAKLELDMSKFSFKGGTQGIADRAVESLLTIADAARLGLTKSAT